MDQLEAKKQKFLQNATYYQEDLSEHTEFQTQITTEQLATYDSDQMDAEHATAFRKQLKEMMLIDEKSAEELKEEYRDVWSSAQEEKKRLTTEANRTGLSKIRHDFRGKQKAAARARLAELGKSKKKLDTGLKKERIQALTNQIDPVFQAKRQEYLTKESEAYESAKRILHDEMIAQGQTEEDFQKRVEAAPSKIQFARQVFLAKITDDMDPEVKAEALRHNETTNAYFNQLTTQENRLVSKYDGHEGLFAQKSAMFELSDTQRAIKSVGDAYKAKYPDIGPGDVLRTDVHRDCCRWISPIWHSHEADIDEMRVAIVHLKTLNDIKKSNQIADPQAANNAVAYIEAKMDLFISESGAFMAAHPSLFGPNPDYGDLVEFSDEISELYKKSQSQDGIGKAICTASAYMATLSKERQEELLDKRNYLGCMMGRLTQLFCRGKSCDDIVRAGGLPDDGNPEPLMDFQDYLKTRRAEL